MAQNDRNFCPLYSIFQEPYIIWWLFMVHMCKMIISPGVFFMFSKFWYSGLLLGGGGGTAKNAPKWKKILSVVLHISGTIHDRHLLYLREVTVSPGIFSFFQNFDFPGWKNKSIQSSQYLRNRKPYDHDLWYTFVEWWYLQDVFYIFNPKYNIVNIKILAFFIVPLQQFLNSCFSSSSINAKKKFWRVPHLFHMCDFLINTVYFVLS